MTYLGSKEQESMFPIVSQLGSHFGFARPIEKFPGLLNTIFSEIC